MSRTLRRQCLSCGRSFEVSVLEECSSECDAGFPQRSPSFCPLCKARIEKEAGDAQQDPKPM
ncbi:MAG: hypothetical protein GX890_03515 [Firmicutes bacterium]|nr:hypothetical protein [Bacillota bacterium]HPU01305.1 hypothetical protein [Bacillota bacterium]